MGIRLHATNNTSGTPKSIPYIYTLWGIACARVFGYSDYQEDMLMVLHMGVLVGCTIPSRCESSQEEKRDGLSACATPS